MSSPYKSDNERCADVLVFLIAGHDSTAYSLSWVILEVARNPTVLQRIQEELDKVHPNKNEPFNSVTDLHKLEYLSQVISEAMRLWPAAADGSVRRLPKDLEHNGYVLPKGSSLVIPFFVLFRSGIEVC